MEPRLSFVTLGVKDLERAVRFYRDVLKLPQKETPPSVAFFELGKTWLALWPAEELSKDSGLPMTTEGTPRIALAHNVRSPEEVDRIIDEAVQGGAKLVKAGHKAFWGGYTGYFTDPEGFLWEVAWNPEFPHV